MMMNRHKGIQLSLATRRRSIKQQQKIQKLSSSQQEGDKEEDSLQDDEQHTDVLQSSNWENQKRFIDAITFKDWRNGVTGSIQITAMIQQESGVIGDGDGDGVSVDDGPRNDSSRSNDDGNCGCSMMGESDEKSSCTNDDAFSIPPPPPPPPTTSPKQGNEDIGYERSTSSTPTLTKARSTKNILLLEIERCYNLKIPATRRFRRSLYPLVIIRVNQQEVGRTPILKQTENPIWYDECYQIPINTDDHNNYATISFEVWSVSMTSSSTSSHQKDSLEIDDFVGKTTFMFQSFVEKLKMDVYHNFRCELKRRGTSIEENNAVKDTKYVPFPIVLSPSSSEIECPHGGEMSGDDTDNNYDNDDDDGTTGASIYTDKSEGQFTSRRETIRIHPTTKHFYNRKGRRRSTFVEKPDSTRYELGRINLRIPNPQPFRRKDIREIEEASQKVSMIESTSFKAITLILVYMTVGVIGYSYVFEHWTIRDSLYFSVVTFTTVGYGDIEPITTGGKLFSCIFALMGIGIIGIALGYIGQNLVQAQVTAIQKAQRKGVNDKSIRSQDKEEDEEEESADFESEHTNSTQEKPDLLDDEPQQQVLWNVSMFLFPIVGMILFGSIIVGSNEGWNWIDSIYWCIMTGTSVGYGDFVPTKNEMRWFSVVFIPIAVGVVSAALGRIANIFVEKEIAKSNTKLLTREVTLEDLEDMNADGDGEVSLLEFVEHMLKSMHKVDQHLLDELHLQFGRLDADGSGGLQQDDLELLTERKLTERRNKAMERYKSSMLDRSSGVLNNYGSRSPKIVPKG